jgi:hypothetical protein
MPMKNRYIELDFGTVAIYATVFDTPIAKKFHQNLPITKLSNFQTASQNHDRLPYGDDQGVDRGAPRLI